MRKFILSFFLVLLPMFVFGAPEGSALLKLVLSGDPASTSFIQERLQATLGKMYDLDLSSVSIHPLLPYKQELLSIPASMRGDTGKSGTIAVLIQNQAAPLLPGTFLLFSDHPEIVNENGLLFSAGIIRLRPVRLNYYHQNADKGPDRAIAVRVANDNDSPAMLHVIQAEAGPSNSIMATGHLASYLFLKRYQSNQGMFYAIPPKGSVMLSKQVMKAGELATGFLQIQEVSGHPLQLTVTAEDPQRGSQDMDGALESSDTHARGAYDIPHLFFITRYSAASEPSRRSRAGLRDSKLYCGIRRFEQGMPQYSAGQETKVIPLGDLPLENLVPGQPLKGTYGMIWEGMLKLENSSRNKAKVFLYFQPRGGSATATFIINDVLRRIDYTPPYRVVPLMNYDLAPREQKIIHVLSMPEGGSSYPIQLIVSSEEIVSSKPESKEDVHEK